MKNRVIKVMLSSVEVTLDSPELKGSSNCAMVEPRCRSISSPATSAAQKGMPKISPMTTPMIISLISSAINIRVEGDCSPDRATKMSGAIGIDTTTATALRIMPVSPSRLNAGVMMIIPKARATAMPKALSRG